MSTLFQKKINKQIYSMSHEIFKVIIRKNGPNGALMASYIWVALEILTYFIDIGICMNRCKYNIDISKQKDIGRDIVREADVNMVAFHILPLCLSAFVLTR